MSKSLGRFEETRISKMNLSPTSSPRRRAATEAQHDFMRPKVVNRAYASPLKEHQHLNTTPLREQQLLPSAYMSPRLPPGAHSFVRTHSSPSIIDASPKMKKDQSRDAAITPSPTSVSGATFAPTRITPPGHGSGSYHMSELTPVTSNTARESCTIYAASPSHSRINSALEEHLSVPEAKSFKSAFRTSTNDATTRNMMILPRQDSHDERLSKKLALRPISPPSWPQRRSPDDAASASVPVTEPEADQVLLDRSCHSFVGISEYRMRSVFPSSAENSSPLARGPENMVPYQPARDSRLASFGIVRDDAGSIFLNNFHNRSRSGQPTSEGDDMDDTDLSVPSIHLATELYSSNTTDSYTTISGGEDRGSFMEDESTFTEDESMEIVGNISYEEPKWGCFPQMNIIHRSPKKLLNGFAIKAAAAVDAESRPSSRKKSSRFMTPEKEREVFDWLHSLEVDKDNNEYVAEAASSKFLTGKMDIEEVPAQHVFYTNDIEPVEPVAQNVAKRNHSESPTPTDGQSLNAVRPQMVMGYNIGMYDRKKGGNPKAPSKRPVLRSCSGM
jgi:hypothetical protein